MTQIAVEVPTVTLQLERPHHAHASFRVCAPSNPGHKVFVDDHDGSSSKSSLDTAESPGNDITPHSVLKAALRGFARSTRQAQQAAEISAAQECSQLGGGSLHSVDERRSRGPDLVRRDSEASLPESKSGLADLPSVGSAKHAAGTCRPCLHISARTGCKSGRNCSFCHIAHEKKHRRRPCKAKRDHCKRLVAMVGEAAPDAYAMSVPDSHRTTGSTSTAVSYLNNLLKGGARASSVVEDENSVNTDTIVQKGEGLGCVTLRAGVIQL
eukprot:TRINITY_DN44702_c0_g1_i1.p1 TRINITY_DN44702_c0_g1~~TRINITY_DN44702_c0_g1_i1.p1  ORF type:complete len:268 (+),score=38.96 TRINITY_DN44702_c0_g1_i1:71-874(+)